MRTDGLGTLIGGIFDTFPYTSISQNVGLVGVTGGRSQQMPKGLHPLLESGILLTALAAVLLNIYFNGARGSAEAAVESAKLAEAH